MSDELTNQEHWNDVWSRDRSALDGDVGRRPSGTLRSLAAHMREYSEHALWDVLYPRYVPRVPGGKVIEVGSAPGSFLVRFARTFDLEPFGIEYTPSGAEMNREVFRRSGFDETNVIEGDFFDPELLARHRERYDVVMSRGFVEHFSDVGRVVERHVALLKPGGLLIIAIPRFRGVYRAWMRAFDAEDLARHNLDIMEKAAFAQAFAGQPLEPCYCGYYGGVAFQRFMPKGESAPARAARKVLKRATQPLNGLLRLVLRGPGLENRWLSPYLIYLGKRTAVA
jgi:2-polyprenyl-3-methyl-5-hydroxy-6-metoxy-1,4-benzoquinol methylase